MGWKRLSEKIEWGMWGTQEERRVNTNKCGCENYTENVYLVNLLKIKIKKELNGVFLNGWIMLLPGNIDDVGLPSVCYEYVFLLLVI